MNYKTSFLLFIGVFGLLPILAIAADPLVYKPLVGIPGIEDANSFGEYINALYGLSIAVAALMAVIKIIIAGVKYMLSDVVTSKQEAIGDIRGSLLGLGVVISAVLVLNIINPQLTKTEIFIDPVLSPNLAPAAAGNLPPVTVKNGYRYRTAHPDPAFQAGCVTDAAPDAIYALTEGKDACYDPVPPAETALLYEIFKFSPVNFTVLINNYQTAHRPRLITDAAKLTQIAVAEGSKSKNATDVMLAVRFDDGTAENPVDFVDSANARVINDTCLKFQQALSTSSIAVRIEKKGNQTKGYLACVRMPDLPN